MLRLLALSLATLVLALPSVASARTPLTGGESTPSGGAEAPLSIESLRSSPAGGAMAPGPEPSSESPEGPVARAAEDPEAPPDTGAQPQPDAQTEPEPEPEGPGQQQPGEQPPEPGGGPQTPTTDEPAAEDAPAATSAAPAPTAVGLPVSGFEALKLVLLGFVLFLVGARLRAVSRRRRSRSWDFTAPGAPAGVAAPVYESHDDAAPAGLMPSTAMARRRAEPAGDQRR